MDNEVCIILAYFLHIYRVVLLTYGADASGAEKIEDWRVKRSWPPEEYRRKTKNFGKHGRQFKK